MRTKLLKQKNALKARRIRRIRGKISGTAEQPRVALFKSNRHLYAQAIDDVNSVTLASVDGKKLGLSASKEAATSVAKAFAETLKEKDIVNVVFDRRGNQYHGVVAAFAEALRENGITL
ncbi:MAG TPA: 50S ribosomal protein L18 [Epsilonproteobacteria bacterium]|nr:50S ribosomal protein L18 [Campylobacterota bacterium]